MAFFKTPNHIQKLKNTSSLVEGVAVCWLIHSHWTPRNLPALQYTFTVAQGTFKYENYRVFLDKGTCQLVRVGTILK